MRFIRPPIIFIALNIALSACASPDVDTSVDTFSDKQFAVDLDACRGGTVLNVTLHGLGGAVVGSAFGALEGAYHGALAGDAPEGAVIGAVIGSAVGVFAGAFEPFKEKEQSIRRCLTGKGYLVQS